MGESCIIRPVLQSVSSLSQDPSFSYTAGFYDFFRPDSESRVCFLFTPSVLLLVRRGDTSYTLRASMCLQSSGVFLLRPVVESVLSVGAWGGFLTRPVMESLCSFGGIRESLLHAP